MTTIALPAALSGRKDWRAAFSGLRALLANANDTAQVFRIMQALNASSTKVGYERLLQTAEGGRIAWDHIELAEKLSDPDYITRFPEGTVGAAYRAFLTETGYTATGLADTSRSVDPARDAPHPYAWYGRRTRDMHDIWHLLTGYSADDPLGEACLTAFSFAQTRGLGWAMIATGAALRSLFTRSGVKVMKAIWEGYRNGQRAVWLPGEDYDRLLAEPFTEARARLNIKQPAAYLAIAGRPAA